MAQRNNFLPLSRFYRLKVDGSIMKEHSTLAIIQARMGSQRFFGKTMHLLAGKPSIAHLLGAVLNVFPRENIFIATSVAPANDAIEHFAKECGVQVYRGDENNVAGRFLAIIEKENPAAFVRLNADSPLLDYRIILAALRIMAATKADLVSTAFASPFPSGMNVEIVQSRIFLSAYKHFHTESHFEHVTRYFYENGVDYHIESVPCTVDDPRSFKFTFDTPEDAERLEIFFNCLKLPHHSYSLKEKCAIYTKLFGGAGKC